ncbi:MAG: SRPBCC family protein [Acidimicrobiia bacterium]
MTAPAGVRTEAVIDAPPERVWAVLADLPGWNIWNPTLFDVRRPASASDDHWQAVPGMEVRMNLRLWKLKVPMRQQVRVVDPPRELVWRSKQMLPASAFDVIRTFRLEAVDGGRTRLVQYEEGSGFLAKAIFAVIGKGVTDGYDNMVKALAERV